MDGETNPSSENAAEETQDVPRTIFDQREGVDWLLAWMISLAEQGLECGVTISVRGQVVSGTIIGGRKYFEALGNSLKTASYGGPYPTSGDLKNSLIGGFSAWKDIYPEKKDIPSDYVPQPSFIHLEDARLLQGGKPVNSHGTLWRSQLSSVDGFMLGTITFGR
jgi:hypothetical protein